MSVSNRNEGVIGTPTRRAFLKAVGLAGAGLTLGLRLPSPAFAQTEGADGSTFAPNAFVGIAPDNTVTVMIKHLEMGQGTFTGLSTIVAEELDADWSQVRPEGAPADASRYANAAFGAQGTGGSSSISNSWQQLREAGAAARAMLVAAAAAEWGVPAAEVTTSRSVLRHERSGRSATYGEMSTLAARQPVPDPATLVLKDPKDFVLIGKEGLKRKDTGKTDGTAIFTQDIRMDGMLTAVVAHPPRFGGKVRTVRDGRARDVAGVVDVVRIPGGVAVLARDFWSAKKARDLLEIQWDETNAFKRGSAELFEEYRNLSKGPGVVARNDGDAAAALAGAGRVIEATYEFPYLAHATMEPMNCVVRVNDGSCDIWNGAQLQTGDQALVAEALGIPMEKVSIDMLFAGGSFGRRANPHSDYVVEAALVAKARPGVPVKLVWTREDDTRAGYFRPMYVHRIRGAIDEDGNPVAWEQRIVGQSIFAGTAFEAVIQNGIDNSSVEGASTLPYRIPNLRVDLHTTTIGVPVQWWRSVGHTHTAYSTETFLDELAKAAGRDPVEYRRALLADHPRHLGVLNLAAEKASWGSPLPEGRFRGIAVHESFSSFVAEVAEISMQDERNFRVERVVCAVDCGIAINPDVIRAQMESGIGYGLSPLLMSEITLDEGRVVQTNFHDYQVLRIDRMPEVEVHIVPSDAPPTGVGEPGTPPIAPAVANALFAATGRPQHSLPLKLQNA